MDTNSVGDAKVCETTVVVRYQETDQMGVAHHSVYPVWFEVARSELIKECGMTYGELERAGVMMPLIGLSCGYCGFSRYDDEIVISARVESLTGSRVSFAYEARRRGAVVARGCTEHAFTDRSLKPYNLKKRAPDAYAVLETLAGRRAGQAPEPLAQRPEVERAPRGLTPEQGAS